MAVSAVDTSSAVQTVNSGIGSLANNYETFLKLLTTQLKNQDPLSPLDTKDFTQQLTQMTGVQQQLLTNQLLTQLISQGQVDTSSKAVDLIGKTVTAENPTVALKDGKAQFNYSIASGVAETQFDIINGNGQVVWSGKASDNTAGPHTMTWDGKSTVGKQLPDGGDYSLKVTALSASGKALASTTTVTGLVTGVENVNGQTLLSIGQAKALMTGLVRVQLPES